MKIKTFIEEQKKIKWPSLSNLLTNILIVIGFTSIMCLIFWLLDIGILAIANKVFDIISKI